jgi:PAS domain S-box-containing protein
MTQILKQSDIDKAYRDQKITVLMNAFKDFEERSATLENSFMEMQENFKRLNIELDHKNNYLKILLESISSGVVAIDTLGNITSFNGGAEELTGLKSESAVGRPYMEILGRHIPEQATPIFTLKTKKQLNNKEKEIVLSGGKLLPVRFNTSPIKDSNGRILGAVETFSDLSEIRKMEEEMQRVRTLSALGEMSAAVAHEIRNPLGGIGGFAALLERDLAINDPRKKLVRKILQGVSSLNKIVSNLLLFTRPMRGEFQEIDLGKILSDTLDFAMLGSDGNPKKRIEIKKSFPKKSLMARCDPEKMHQLFLNILQNSLDAMEEKNLLTISIREIKGNDRRLQNRSVNKTIEIKIQDTGAGIKNDDISKLFNPFFTTKEDGTGLGLSIAKKIVELHHGEIDVTSKKGQGSCFIVLLPRK